MSRQECLYCYNSWVCKNPKKKQYEKEADEAVEKGINYIVPCKNFQDESINWDDEE